MGFIRGNDTDGLTIYLIYIINDFRYAFLLFPEQSTFPILLFVR